MKALVELIEKYRPGFAREIEPADEVDIELLEEHAGALPGAYLRFLQTMGSRMGGLELAEADLSIDGKILTYQTLSWLRHGRCLLVAGDNGPAGWDYFLDRAKPHGGDDCLLVRMPLEKNLSPDTAHLAHVGLEEFLYYEAFKAVRLSALPYRRVFTSPDAPNSAPRYRSDLVSTLADEHDFKRIPPTERCALYDRDDACLLLYRHPAAPMFSLSLGCEDPVKMELLASEFEARTQLKGVIVKG
ncbi:hypothetical protein [Myxococcus sp. CA039A]|uniref:hypothetical protein n=1 Tax=Myxococcus sp. CA039A TaxID=2741737 RepID=UPI0020C70F43|nr:hypothetical protein [Myxococcus sp. CA039A]